MLGFFNQWVSAVGHADADTAQNYFFAMSLFFGKMMKDVSARSG